MLAVMVLSAVVNGAYANGTNNLVGGTDNVATANSANSILQYITH